MKKVLVFGTFDVLHPGHTWFLRSAAGFGDFLIAVVARDDFIRQQKGRAPLLSQRQRMAALAETGLANRVVPADLEIKTYKVVHCLRPDIIVLGHDQIALRDNIRLVLGDTAPELQILPPWQRHRYSSSARNRELRNRFSPEKS